MGGADRPSLVEAAERLGAILDERHIVSLRECDEGIEIDRMTIEMDRHDSADPPPGGLLCQAVADSTGVTPTFATEEMQRVLELGALEARPGKDGVRFAWTE